jgi:hypothetical protein
MPPALEATLTTLQKAHLDSLLTRCENSAVTPATVPTLRKRLFSVVEEDLSQQINNHANSIRKLLTTANSPNTRDQLIRTLLEIAYKAGKKFKLPNKGDVAVMQPIFQLAKFALLSFQSSNDYKDLAHYARDIRETEMSSFITQLITEQQETSQQQMADDIKFYMEEQQRGENPVLAAEQSTPEISSAIEKTSIQLQATRIKIGKFLCENLRDSNIMQLFKDSTTYIPNEQQQGDSEPVQVWKKIFLCLYGAENLLRRIQEARTNPSLLAKIDYSAAVILFTPADIVKLAMLSSGIVRDIIHIISSDEVSSLINGVAQLPALFTSIKQAVRSGNIASANSGFMLLNDRLRAISPLLEVTAGVQLSISSMTPSSLLPYEPDTWEIIPDITPSFHEQSEPLFRILEPMRTLISLFSINGHMENGRYVLSTQEEPFENTCKIFYNRILACSDLVRAFNKENPISFTKKIPTTVASLYSGGSISWQQSADSAQKQLRDKTISLLRQIYEETLKPSLQVVVDNFDQQEHSNGFYKGALTKRLSPIVEKIQIELMMMGIDAENPCSFSESQYQTACTDCKKAEKRYSDSSRGIKAIAVLKNIADPHFIHSVDPVVLAKAQSEVQMFLLRQVLIDKKENYAYFMDPINQFGILLSQPPPSVRETFANALFAFSQTLFGSTTFFSKITELERQAHLDLLVEKKQQQDTQERRDILLLNKSLLMQNYLENDRGLLYLLNMTRESKRAPDNNLAQKYLLVAMFSDMFKEDRKTCFEQPHPFAISLLETNRLEGIIQEIALSKPELARMVAFEVSIGGFLSVSTWQRTWMTALLSISADESAEKKAFLINHVVRRLSAKKIVKLVEAAMEEHAPMLQTTVKQGGVSNIENIMRYKLLIFLMQAFTHNQQPVFETQLQSKDDPVDFFYFFKAVSNSYADLSTQENNTSEPRVFAEAKAGIGQLCARIAIENEDCARNIFTSLTLKYEGISQIIKQSCLATSDTDPDPKRSRALYYEAYAATWKIHITGQVLYPALLAKHELVIRIIHDACYGNSVDFKEQYKNPNNLLELLQRFHETHLLYNSDAQKKVKDLYTAVLLCEDCSISQEQFLKNYMEARGSSQIIGVRMIARDQQPILWEVLKAYCLKRIADHTHQNIQRTREEKNYYDKMQATREKLKTTKANLKQSCVNAYAAICDFENQQRESIPAQARRLSTLITNMQPPAASGDSTTSKVVKFFVPSPVSQKAYDIPQLVQQLTKIGREFLPLSDEKKISDADKKIVLTDLSEMIVDAETKRKAKKLLSEEELKEFRDRLNRIIEVSMHYLPPDSPNPSRQHIRK